MVKNQFGGNKSKKMGRKFISAPVDRKLRLAEDEDEKYAVVTKLLGQGMMYVDVASDKSSTEMLCIIRKKFKGRGKRDNTVRIGTLILAGIRSWEVTKDGSKPKCDLLEVYNDIEVNKLKKGGHINMLISKITEEAEDVEGVVFEDEQTSHYKDLMDATDDTKNNNIIGITSVSDDEDFDIDDI